MINKNRNEAPVSRRGTIKAEVPLQLTVGLLHAYRKKDTCTHSAVRRHISLRKKKRI